MTKQEFIDKWKWCMSFTSQQESFKKDLDALLSSQQGGKVTSEEIIDVVGGKSEFKKLANIEPSAVCDNSRLATDKANAMFQEESPKAQDSVIEPKQEEKIIDDFVCRLFEELNKLGIDTSTCDGDTNPEDIIANWIAVKIQETNENIRIENPTAVSITVIVNGITYSMKAGDIISSLADQPKEESKEPIKFAEWVDRNKWRLMSNESIDKWCHPLEGINFTTKQIWDLFKKETEFADEIDQPKVSEPVKSAEEWHYSKYARGGDDKTNGTYEWFKEMEEYLKYANQFKNSK